MERGAEKSIDERMEDAKKSDIKAKNSMNVCRACVCDVPSHFELILLPVPSTQPAKHSNQGLVKFHILRTLLDPDPIIVTRECRIRDTLLVPYS
jgi:hypothetical protein